MKKLLILAIILGSILPMRPTSASLSEFYAERGRPLPTVQERIPLALEYGIQDYRGTKAQNDLLEAYLRGGVAEELVGGTVTKPYTFSPSTVIRSSEINSNFDTLYTLVNGNIENVNIKTAAEIAASKIAGTAIVANPSAAQSISATTTFSGTVFVSSTTGFFAVPRMTAVQRDALVGLENGALIYNTTAGEFQVREGGAWAGVTASAVATVASLTAKGIVELGTGLEAASSTPAGTGDTNAPLAIHTGITTTTPYTSGNWIPVTKSNGKLDKAVIDQGESYGWTAPHTFSSGTTFSASSSLYRYADDTGTANAYVASYSPTVSSCRYGDRYSFKASATSTAASTFNNGGCTKTIKVFNRDLGFADIRGGQVVTVVDAGGVFQLQTPFTYPSASYVPLPAYGATTSSILQISTNTRLQLGAFFLEDTSMTDLSVYVATVGSAGRLKIGLYTLDGENLITSTTTPTISSTGVKTFTFDTPPSIPRGTYYLGVVPEGTADISLYFWDGTSNPAALFTDTISGRADLSGYATVSASTLPSSFNPTTLTNLNRGGLVWRVN